VKSGGKLDLYWHFERFKNKNYITAQNNWKTQKKLGKYGNIIRITYQFAKIIF